MIESLIDAKTIAVVGASPKGSSFGGAVVRNLKKHFSGTVIPVNPNYEEIDGLQSYRSLEAIGLPVDCVGIAVPASQVPAVLADAAKANIKFAILFSSGFADLGTDDGRKSQAALVDLARSLGIRILGPNCTGFVNVHTGAACHILPSVVDLPMNKGSIAVIGQSGALGYVILQAMHRGVGFSKVISTGNSSDIDLADVIDYLVRDDSTKSIALVFESVPDGARLISALGRAFVAGKPVVVYKIGTSESGKKAALSHSGMLAGNAAAYNAAFARTGAIQVFNFESLLETAHFFSIYGYIKPKSQGVGVISGSGGSVVMAADKADELGVALPQPNAETVTKLSSLLPSFAAIANPADMTAESVKDDSMYAECLKAFAGDDQFASLILLMPSAHGHNAIPRANLIDRAAREMAAPMSLVWINEWHEGVGSRVYDASPNMAVFRSITRCMTAHKLWFDYFDRKQARASQVDEVSAQARRASPNLLLRGRGTTLSERESKEFVATYGVPITRDICVSTVDEAVSAAMAIGFPVVVKVESAAIAHKTEIGGVVLNVLDADQVRSACALIDQACEKHCPDLESYMYSVQEMVPAGIEMIVGGKLDPQVGPMVVYGFGGVFVEVLKDVAVSLAPASRHEIERNLKALKLFPLLEGVRGKKSCDVGAYVDLIVNVSHAIAENQDAIAEIDVNPVILLEDRCVAVDSLVALK